MMKRFGWVGLVLITAMLIPVQQSEVAASDVALVAGSTGLIDEDGTVLYSVILASGEAPIEGISLQAQIPTQATFIETLEFPQSATLVGQVGTAVTWEVALLEANTILGPFTFRVSFPEGFTDIPKGIAATITWVAPTTGIIDATPEEGTLRPLAESGQIVVDAQGTVNEAGENVPLPVGETGIEVLILPNTVAAPTTFTFRRIPITDDVVPEGVEDTWWCVLLEMGVDPAVEITQPIALSIPTRRVLTPGLETTIFLDHADGNWQEFSTPRPEPVSFAPSFAKRSINTGLGTPSQLGFGGFNNCTPMPLGGSLGCGFSQFGGGFGGGCFQFCQFGVGVDVQDRETAEVGSDDLLVLGSESAVDFFATPAELTDFIKPQ